MKSITWTQSMSGAPPEDEEPTVEPDLRTTIERPLVTAELAEKSRPDVEVLRAMSKMYAHYTGGDAE